MGCCGSPVFDEEMVHRLDGKTVAITGASDGIGLATAILCAQRGAKLILLCRNVQKMQNSKNDILSNFPEAEVVTIQMDLADLASVTRAAEEISSKSLVIDILVANAGVVYIPSNWLYLTNSVQVINHFSHALLFQSLLENGSLKEDSRVIFVASGAHGAAKGDGSYWKTYASEESAKGALGEGPSFQAYAESKLANILYSRELAKKYPKMTVLSLHPGAVETNIGGTVKEKWGCWGKFLSCCIFTCCKSCFRTPAQGAQTSLMCICDPNLTSGKYYADLKEAPVKIRGNRMKLDEIQSQLWKLTEDFLKANCAKIKSSSTQKTEAGKISH